jgi:hypothetical protein
VPIYAFSQEPTVTLESVAPFRVEIRGLALEVLDEESGTGFEQRRATDMLARNAAPADVALLWRTAVTA